MTRKKKPTKRKSKKPASNDCRGPAAEWSPDQPLANARHESFAQALAGGNGAKPLPQVEAYERVYGSRNDGNANRLLKGNERIQQRVKWLQEQAAGMVAEQLGLTKIGLAKRLLEMLDTPPTEVLEAVNVWAENRAALTDEQKGKLRLASGVKAGMFGYEVKLSEKAAVAEKLAKIMGWYAEDNAAAAQAAAAASQAGTLAEIVALARRQGSFCSTK